MKKFLALIITLVIVQTIGFIVLGFYIFKSVKTYVNSDYNRYSLYQHSTYRADKYILDHKTGRIWTEYAEQGKNNYWLEMNVKSDSNYDENYAPWENSK